MKYEIITLTHIVATDALQALLSFDYKGRTELTTVLINISDAGSNLTEIYTNQNFIDACKASITTKIYLIDNPVIIY